jgi:hypothetical protein
VKAIFTAAVVGTWKINAEMLATMLFIFFTLVKVLAHHTIVHETVSRETGTHRATMHAFTQLGAAPIVDIAWKFLTALLPAFQKAVPMGTATFVAAWGIDTFMGTFPIPHGTFVEVYAFSVVFW